MSGVVVLVLVGVCGLVLSTSGLIYYLVIRPTHFHHELMLLLCGEKKQKQNAKHVEDESDGEVDDERRNAKKWFHERVLDRLLNRPNHALQVCMVFVFCSFVACLRGSARA
jgi:hypothetical protein